MELRVQKQMHRSVVNYFPQSAEIIQWEKGQSFQQMVLGQLDIHMPKNKVGTLPHTINKDFLKMIRDLNVRATSGKTLTKKSHEVDLCDLGFGKRVFYRISKA